MIIFHYCKGLRKLDMCVRWGVNTINVNGQTMTMVGSMLWGQEVVAAVRDHMEATLREIMKHAPEDGSAKVPEYGKKEV